MKFHILLKKGSIRICSNRITPEDCNEWSLMDVFFDSPASICCKHLQLSWLSGAL